LYNGSVICADPPTSGAGCPIWSKETRRVDGSLAGKIDGADVFDGRNDYVEVNNVPVNTQSGKNTTVEFWMNWKGSNSDSEMPFGWNTTYDLWLYDDCFGFNTGEGNILGVNHTNLGLNLANRWVYVVAKFYNGVPSSANNAFYIDGLERTLINCRGTTTKDVNVTSTFFISGWGVNSGYKFNGTIDEVRISNVSRSASWINASYLSQSDEFVTYGSEESITYNTKGNFTTDTKDATITTIWINITTNTTIPTGTGLSVQVGTSSDNSAYTWGNNHTLTGGIETTTLSVTDNRYAKIRFWFNTSNTSITPTLHDFTLRGEKQVETQQNLTINASKTEVYGDIILKETDAGFSNPYSIVFEQTGFTNKKITALNDLLELGGGDPFKGILQINDSGGWLSLQGATLYGSRTSGYSLILDSNPSSDGFVSVGSLFKLDKEASALPCDSTREASVYYDTDLHKPCYCNSTDWVQIDGGGTC
jgi:hypothetical protein